MKAAFDAKKTCEIWVFSELTSVRKAVLGMMAVHRLQDHNAGQAEPEKAKLKKEVEQYKDEAEKVRACALVLTLTTRKT